MEKNNQCNKKVNKKVTSKLETKMSSTSNSTKLDTVALGGNDVLSDFGVTSALNMPVEVDEHILNETFDCQLSESDDDEGSDPESFQEESLYETSSSFLSSMKALQSIDLQSVDPETRARLQVLLEAADLVKINSVDGGLIANQKLIKKLTSSVSEALDEAATALIKMREEQNSVNDHNDSLVSYSTNNDITNMVVMPQQQHQQMLKQGCMLSRTNEEGESLLSMAASSGYYELCQVLLATNADVEDRGVKGDCTPLMEASARGFVDIIQLLLHNKACINAKSAAGNTALHYAASGGHEQAVQVLIKAGADVEAANENGHTPLMEAASVGHVGVAKLLIENGAYVNTHSSEFKESALTLACYKGHTDMVQYLLNAGADIEHKTDEMHTALMEACIDGFVDVARLLIDRGAKVNMLPDSFESPLTLVACGGHVELGNLLLSRGAKVDERNDEGYTPLMEASREGHVEISALFLNHGADINAITDETRETALTLACCGGFLEVVEFLYQEGADIELGGSTPLMEAAQEGHLDVIKFLLGIGANVNAIGQMGDTALSCACENGHTEVAELLLKTGSNLEHESESGRTPLMKATRMGHLSTVQFLVSQGASVNKSTTNNDQTVLSLACVGGHLKVVEFLLKHGANAAHKLKDGSTMLIEAAKGGHAQIVSLLLDWSMMLQSTDSNKLNNQQFISATKKPVIVKQQQPLPPQQPLPQQPVPHQPLPQQPLPQQTLPQQPLPQQTQRSTAEGCVDNVTQQLDNTNQVVTGMHNTKASNLLAPSLPSSLTSAALLTQPQSLLTPLTTNSLDEASLAFVNKATVLSDFLSKADFDLLSTCRVSKVKEQLKDVLTSIMKVDLWRLSPEEQDLKRKQIKIALQQLEDASDQSLNENDYCHVSDGDAEDEDADEEYDEDEDDEEVIGLKVKKCENEILELEKQLDKVTMSENEASLIAKMDETDDGSKKSQQHVKEIVKNKNEDKKKGDKQVTKLLLTENQQTGERVRQEGDGCSGGMDSAVHDLSGTSSSLSSSSSSSSSSSASEVEKFEDACFCCCTNEKPEATVDRGESTEGRKRACINQIDNDVSTTSSKGSMMSSTSSLLATTITLTLSITSGINTSTTSSTLTTTSSFGSKITATIPSINLKRDREAFSENAAIGEVADETPNATSSLPTSSPSASSNHLSPVNPIAPQNRVIAKGHRKLPQKPKVPTVDQHSNNNINNLPSINMQQLTSFDYISSFNNVQQQQQLMNNTNNLNINNSGSKVEMIAQKNFIDMLCCEEDAGIPIFKERNTKIDQEEMSLPNHQMLKHKQVIHTLDPAKKDCIASAPKSQPKIMSTLSVHTNLNPLNIQQQNTNKPIQQELIQKAKLWKQQQQQEQILKNNQQHLIQQQQQQLGIKKISNATTMKNLQENNVAKIVYAKPKQFTMNNGRNDGGKSAGKKFPKTSNRVSGHREHREQNRDLATSVFPTIEVNAQTEANHDTALTLASAGGHSELVSLLLARGADVEHRDKKGFTSLVLAAAAGHLQVVNVLLDHGADVETQLEQTKDTALSLACSGGRHDVVEALLRHGADKEHRNASDYTPLCLAASGGHVSVIRLLLLHGAEINSRTSSRLGISPLMLASMNGHAEAVRLLLDMGGDVNAQIETNRNTALTLACFQGRHEVVELLADRKANLEHRAKKGLTPLMEAAAGGFVDVGRVLLDRGADVCAVHASSTRDTALTIAADKGHFKFVELLVLRGAPVDVKTKKGHTALWLACNGGHLEVVQLLVGCRADPDSCDNRQISCLIAAFKRGHVKVVRWLVRHVTQLPSDQECDRCMAQIGNDKDLLKRCQQCMEIIFNAKEKQAMEANKIANSLLLELAQEQSIVESKKAAALRKRQKRKMKKKKTKSTMVDTNDENVLLEEEKQAELLEIEKKMDDGIVETSHSNEIPPKISNVVAIMNEKNRNHDNKVNSKPENVNSFESHDGQKSSNNANATSSSINNLSNTSTASVLMSINSKSSRKSSKRHNQISQIKEAINSSMTSPASTQNGCSLDSKMDSPSLALSDINYLDMSTSHAKTNKPTFSFNDYSATSTNISDLDDFRLERDVNTRSITSTQNLSSLLSTSSATTAAVASEQLKLMLSKDQPDTSIVLNSSKNISNNLIDPISNYSSKPSRLGLNCKNNNTNTIYKLSKTKEEGWKEVSRKCKKINVPAKCISRLIGRAGCNINAIRESSGAHIDLDKMKNSSDGLITLKGSPEAILLASKLVEAIINEPDADVEQLITYYKATLNFKINTKPVSSSSCTIPQHTQPILSSNQTLEVPSSKDAWKVTSINNNNGSSKIANSINVPIPFSTNYNKNNPTNNSQVHYNGGRNINIFKPNAVRNNNSDLHDKIHPIISISTGSSTQTTNSQPSMVMKKDYQVTSVWKIPVCESIPETKVTSLQNNNDINTKNMESFLEDKHNPIKQSIHKEDDVATEIIKVVSNDSTRCESDPVELTENISQSESLAPVTSLCDVTGGTSNEVSVASITKTITCNDLIATTSSKTITITNTTSYPHHSLGGLINSDFSPFNHLLSRVTESFLLGKNKEPKKDFASVAASSLMNNSISSSLLSSSSLISSLSPQVSSADQMSNSALQAKAPGFRPIGFGVTQQRKSPYVASVSPMPNSDSNNIDGIAANNGRRKLYFEDDKDINKNISSFYPNQRAGIISSSNNAGTCPQNVGVIGSGAFTSNNNPRSSSKSSDPNKKSSERNKLNPDAPNFTSSIGYKRYPSSSHPNNHSFSYNENNSKLFHPSSIIPPMTSVTTGQTFNPLIGNERMLSSSLSSTTNATNDDSNLPSSNTSVLFGLSNQLWKFNSRDAYKSGNDLQQSDFASFPDANTLYSQSYTYPRYFGEVSNTTPNNANAAESYSNINFFGSGIGSYNKSSLMSGDNGINYLQPQSSMYPVRHDNIDQTVNQAYGHMIMPPHLNYHPVPMDMGRGEGCPQSKPFVVTPAINEPHLGWQP